MSWEEVLIYVIDVIAKIIVTLIIPYVFYLIRQKVKNDIVTNLIEDAKETVSDCVLTVNQTFVDALKAEGAFDEAAKKKAYNRCVDEVLAILSDAAKEAIISTAGDLNKWLEIQIESNVKTHKKSS